jgi:co-chaperonin GroES (HSP10)
MSKVNPSGLEPVEYKVIVRLDKVDKVTSGGIIIPIALADKQQMHQVQATLTAIGGNAFEDWKGAVPVVGDRVYVAKAAGYQVVGMDREKYQLMNDKDIAAVIGG